MRRAYTLCCMAGLRPRGWRETVTSTMAGPRRRAAGQGGARGALPRAQGCGAGDGPRVRDRDLTPERSGELTWGRPRPDGARRRAVGRMMGIRSLRDAWPPDRSEHMQSSCRIRAEENKLFAELRLV